VCVLVWVGKWVEVGGSGGGVGGGGGGGVGGLRARQAAL
jgi:hypothetical protein